MRQFTKEEYQILLEGMEQLLADYKEAEKYNLESLRDNSMVYGFCCYLKNNRFYKQTTIILLSAYIQNYISYNDFLFLTPLGCFFENGNYTKGITNRINWLQQKISEIKIILDESNTQN